MDEIKEVLIAILDELRDLNEKLNNIPDSTIVNEINFKLDQISSGGSIDDINTRLDVLMYKI